MVAGKVEPQILTGVAFYQNINNFYFDPRTALIQAQIPFNRLVTLLRTNTFSFFGDLDDYDKFTDSVLLSIQGVESLFNSTIVDTAEDIYNGKFLFWSLQMVLGSMIHNAHNRRVKESAKGEGLLSFNMDNEVFANRTEVKQKKRFYKKLAYDLNISVRDVIYLENVHVPKSRLMESQSLSDEYMSYPEYKSVLEGSSMLRKTIDDVQALTQELKKLNTFMQKDEDNSFEIKHDNDGSIGTCELNDPFEDFIEEITITDLPIRNLSLELRADTASLDQSIDLFFSQLENNTSQP